MNSLIDAKVGQSYYIQDVLGDPGVSERIAELGIIPGREIIIQQKLPFHGPYIVKVRSTFVSLRREEAAIIMIRGNE